jgi:putative transcriptional regulator
MRLEADERRGEMKRERLISRRVKLSLSQQNVADLSGISRSFYTRIELGIETPSLEVAFRIADALQSDTDFLFRFDVRNTNKTAS